MVQFKELGKVKISPKRNLVLSKNDRNNLVIVQQLELKEDGRSTNIFMKGAIIISKDSIYNVRDKLNEAIAALEDEGILGN